MESLSGDFSDLSQMVVVSSLRKGDARCARLGESRLRVHENAFTRYYQNSCQALGIPCLQPNMRLDGTVEFLTDTALRHRERHLLQGKSD